MGDCGCFRQKSSMNLMLRREAFEIDHQLYVLTLALQTSRTQGLEKAQRRSLWIHKP